MFRIHPNVLIWLFTWIVTAAGSNSTVDTLSSPWLEKVSVNHHHPTPRPVGCRFRPWICRQREHPPAARMRCCQNQCVDVASDVNHCGLCGIRCRFTWQCCRGFCSNVSFSWFNCGKCGNRCPWGSRCFYGMCGYAEPWPPRPRPPHPRPPPRPHPPKPPHRPCPPRPPHHRPPWGHQPPPNEL